MKTISTTKNAVFAAIMIGLGTAAFDSYGQSESSCWNLDFNTCKPTDLPVTLTLVNGCNPPSSSDYYFPAGSFYISGADYPANATSFDSTQCGGWVNPSEFPYTTGTVVCFTCTDVSLYIDNNCKVFDKDFGPLELPSGFGIILEYPPGEPDCETDCGN